MAETREKRNSCRPIVDSGARERTFTDDEAGSARERTQGRDSRAVEHRRESLVTLGGDFFGPDFTMGGHWRHFPSLCHPRSAENKSLTSGNSRHPGGVYVV